MYFVYIFDLINLIKFDALASHENNSDNFLELKESFFASKSSFINWFIFSVKSIGSSALNNKAVSLSVSISRIEGKLEEYYLIKVLYFTTKSF